MKYKSAKKYIYVIVQGGPEGYKVGEAKEAFKAAAKGFLSSVGGFELKFQKGKKYAVQFDAYKIYTRWKEDGEAGVFFGFADKYDREELERILSALPYSAGVGKLRVTERADSITACEVE